MANIPTITSSTRPATAVAGDAYFETDTGNFIIWNGSTWNVFQTDSILLSSNQSSASFDGTDDIITISNASSIAITGDMTITAWLYLGATGAFQYVAVKRASGTNYQFYIRDTDILSFYDGSNIVNDTTTLSGSTWYHVAVVVDAGSSTKFYIDGSLSSTGVSTSPVATTDDLFLGALPSLSQYLNGNLDDVAIFNRALSAGEISDIYNNNLYRNPVALWRFENNAQDSIGSNHGTGSGGVILNSGNKPY
jgi:hypothetical protein